jgi:hypothetical protein
MIRRIAPLALAISATLVAKAPLKPLNVTTTQSADFTAGATVRIAGTAGELDIQAWDEPRVQATLTSTEYADAGERDEVKKKLERIGLTVEKRGGDVAVDLKTPSRHFWARWLRGKTNATVVLRVLVPRDAKLVVRHEDGSVMVYGVAGDIDASVRFGDIVLQLADPAQYSIHAKIRFGGVYTDYEGSEHHRMPLGENFLSDGGAGAHKLTLQVYMGGIDIVKMGPVAKSGF